MYTWFQNLNDDGQRLFYFRGSLGRAWDKIWFRYEIASGLALKFKYQHGEAGDDSASSMISIGLFFITVYLQFCLPKSWYFKKKCIATWDGNREFYLIEGRQYGFYFYEWAFVWSFHERIHESRSTDPWWMQQYIHLDELILGKWERLENKIIESANVKFKLDGKEFVMNEIKWIRNRRFRRFIPYSLYHHTYYSCEMNIEKPPMRAGKGENSYDCDDDGTFSSYGSWKHEIPSWTNRAHCTRLAIDDYVKNFKRDAQKYGRGDGERGCSKYSVYEYIGIAQ